MGICNNYKPGFYSKHQSRLHSPGLSIFMPIHSIIIFFIATLPSLVINGGYFWTAHIINEKGIE